MATFDHNEQHFFTQPFTFGYKILSNIYTGYQTRSCVNNRQYTNTKNEIKILDVQETSQCLKIYNTPPYIEDLPKFNGNYKTIVEVVSNDIVDQGLIEKMNQNPVILNMASFLHPGGGFKKGALAQEEDMCRRSDMWLHLESQTYPMPTAGGFYISKINIFRFGRDRDYAFMDEPIQIAVLCVAAVKNPDTLVANSNENENEKEKTEELILTEKARDWNFRAMYTQFKMSLDHQHDVLILGAFGCGAYHNPPREIANIYMKVLSEYFPGCFKKVTFSIIPKTGQNYKTFSEIVNQFNNKTIEISTQNL